MTARAMQWLVWDTFRQAQASAAFWLPLLGSAAAVAYCSTASLGDGPREEAVRSLHQFLGAGVADVAGVLFALVWTASFLPAFLQSGSVSVLLAKPVPRGTLLAGKYLGAVLFVLFQASVFVVGTWLALGIRTGVWSPRYLLAVPVVTLHFAVFFSFSCLLAVWTRSTVVCVFGSVLFWFVCWGMNYGRHAALVHLADHAELTGGYLRALEVGYWALPRPADLGHLLSVGLGAATPWPVGGVFARVEELGAWSPVASTVGSAVFAAVMLGLSWYELTEAEH